VQDTSGLQLVAINPAAQQSLYHQFRSRSVYKEYTALVKG
jgi:23S rRNA-/tRNA-specific pseudouridylate synthase